MNGMLLNSSSDFDVLVTMRHQEKTRYNDKVDFLAEAKNKGIDVQIDEECRRKMARWCYNVCETYQLSTEVAEVAMNVLDRYLATLAGKPALKNRCTYQLACMSCLYTAVKTHETKVVDPQMVSTMLRVGYSEKDVIQMESNILTALQYRVHPPTSMSFVRSYLDLITTTMMIPSLMDPQHRQTVMEVSAKQVQEALSLYQFVTVQASMIGYCCLMNSLEVLGMLVDQNVRTGVKWFLMQFLSDANATDLSDEYSRMLYSVISGKYTKIRIPKGPRRSSIQKLLFRVKIQRKIRKYTVAIK
jgi:hypothetical protein